MKKPFSAHAVLRTLPQLTRVTSALARAREKEEHFQGVSRMRMGTTETPKLFEIKILPVTDSAARFYSGFSRNLMIPIEQRGGGTALT
jgi:hypothetical protein